MALFSVAGKEDRGKKGNDPISSIGFVKDMEFMNSQQNQNDIRRRLVSKMNTTDMMNNDYLTVAQIKECLNISQASAYRLVEEAEFQVFRWRGSIRIPRESFQAWLESRTVIPDDWTG